MKTKIKNPKDYRRKRRHMHVRSRIFGTADRPRICVFRSNTHIYAQVIDDEEGRTLLSVSSLKVKAPVPPPAAAADETEGKEAKDAGKKGKKKGGKKARPESVKMLQAREVGRMVAEAAKEKGITKVRFDRGGYLYHGRVAALAEEMRKNGLEF